jgi:hypothetical protein
MFAVNPRTIIRVPKCGIPEPGDLGNGPAHMAAEYIRQADMLVCCGVSHTVYRFEWLHFVPNSNGDER